MKIKSAMINKIKNYLGLQTLNLVAFADSHIGTRQENQDNYLLIQKEHDKITAHFLKDEQKQSIHLSAWPDDSIIRIAVADGMGGHANGRQIAEQLIDELIELPPQYTPENLKQQISDIHKRLYDSYAPHAEKKPGTTLVMADINRQTGKGVLINVGDSRAYIIKKSFFKKNYPTIRQLTKDHSYAEFSYRDGELDKKLYINHINSQQIRIAQAIGLGSRGIIKDDEGFKPNRPDKEIRIDLKHELGKNFQTHADAFSFELKPDELIMLSTDGLWSGESTGHWNNNFLFNKISPHVLKQIIETALEQNANDNITLAISGFQKRAYDEDK